MRKCVFVAILLLSVLSCGTTTRIVHSWRDPDVTINTATPNKFIVAALLKNEAIRRRTEDLMSFYYPGKAVSSYKKFGVAGLRQPQAFYDQQLVSEGFDAVVVMRLAKADKNVKYTPGEYPDYYTSWITYYNNAWPQYYDPGTYTIHKTYYVEVNIYSLTANKLVWSGVTSIINPSGSDDLFDNVITTLTEKMKGEGFLK